jgi:hypothetical protein
MRMRSYALTFVAVAAGFFSFVILANVTIDPEGVLGTGLIGDSINPNDRYIRFRDYKRDADRYDALLFGSSRAATIPLEDLSTRLGGIGIASFSVVGGTIVDHLPVLRYVLRTKAEKGQRLRAVFLLLDIDGFGAIPATNRSIQTLLAPELTGETRERFYWKYLTAIQFRAWRREIERAWNGRRADRREALAPPYRVAAAAATSDAPPPRPAPPEDHAPPATITPAEIERQLALLREFVALCREHGVRLIVASPPVHRIKRAHLDPAEIERVRAEITAIVPVWDFGSPDWLSDRTELWLDTGHFDVSVGAMLLDRIFGGDTSFPGEFGRLYTR